MDNETLKLIEDCRDLLRDINSLVDPRDRNKKNVEDQICKLNNLLDKKVNHMFI